MIEKFGVIYNWELDELKNIIEKYYKRHKSGLHPNFMIGAEYVLKHLNKREL